MSAPSSGAVLPQNLVDNPRLDAWFDLGTPGIVTLRSGKVELGQGIVRALRCIAAEELDLAADRIAVVSGDTARSPYEWFTAGSMSIETSGPSVRLAAAALRARLLGAAAGKLGVEAARLGMAQGMFLVDGKPVQLDLWGVAAGLDLRAVVTGDAAPRPASAYRLVGNDTVRDDLHAKVAGAPYIHDIALPGMLHGRVLRKPSRDARLASFDAARAHAMRGVFKAVRERDFLGVLCTDEFAAVSAVERLERLAQWTEAPSGDRRQAVDYLDALSDRVTVLADDCAQDDWPDGAGIHRAEYSRPLLAHGSIGPACALAQWSDAGLLVWTHSQGVFALRDQVARVTGLPVDRIHVRHLPGAGCYGHTGADDAAMDAVTLARHAEGRPVRVLWRRIDELRHEPLGSPMKVRIAARLGPDQRIACWRLDTWSGAFAQRPGWNGGVNMLAAADGDGGWPFAEPMDLPAHNGGSKNALAIYDFRQTVAHHMVKDLPFRLSALRSLGAFANVYAIESFMDELALAAGEDALHFRLWHLSDERERRVLETVAAMARWDEGMAQGRHLGLGHACFKNKSAYCAVAAEVEMHDEIRLTHIWAVVDAGLAISPDDVKAQVEGGILMAASWTLHEAMPTEGPAITAESWLDYPILRFSDVPRMEVRVISDPALPPLGVGEAALGPTAGAIGNAMARALGMRLRDLPLTKDRIMAALLASD